MDEEGDSIENMDKIEEKELLVLLIIIVIIIVIIINILYECIHYSEKYLKCMHGWRC